MITSRQTEDAELHNLDSPYDAIVIVSFGGPEGMADVIPFLENVLRGRNIPRERMLGVAKHYELFGGISPINAENRKLIAALHKVMEAKGPHLPIYFGNRNWHPLLADTLRQMHADGRRRAVAFIAAPHHSYSSCQQYRENVAAAQKELEAGGGHIDISFVGSWFDHPLFVEANAAHVRAAQQRLPSAVRHAARLVFTAHSIPLSMAEGSLYREQLQTSAQLIARKAGVEDWTLVYQSRSGRPQDPWLEPDVCEYLRQEHAAGLAAAIICPVGFVCDHIEVLYDLDLEAADVCAGLGLLMARAEAVNDDPLFLDMMADVVLATIRRYDGGRALPIVK